MIQKFRGWFGAEMYDEPIVFNGQFYLDYRDFEDYRTYDDAVLMQSTGLFDKNGVEIFESDLVKIKYGDFVYRIKRALSGEWELVRVSMSSNGNIVNQGIAGPLIHHLENVYTIGNIYENLDLLEVDK